MIDRALADAVLVVHGLFVVFVVAGGFLAWRWPRLAWLHLPAAAWGAWIELAGWGCPLTPLENHFRRRGGEAGYSGGCIQHYLTSWIYPEGLTREAQLALAALVVAVNVAAYAGLWARRRRRSTA
jgi:uncharacterized protein DUF2784